MKNSQSILLLGIHQEKYNRNNALASFIFHSLIYTIALTTPLATAIIFIIAAIWALYGIEESIKALALVATIKFINPSITEQYGSSVLTWIVIGAAIIKITLSAPFKLKILKVNFYLILFFIASSIVSFKSSEYIAVSIFKLISFTLTFFYVFVAFDYLREKNISIFSWIFGLWCSILIISFALIPFPGISYFTDGMGFQGVFNQPQVMAIFCAPIAAWSTSIILFSREKSNYSISMVFALSWISIFLTRGRVALASLLISGLIIIISSLFYRRQWLAVIVKGLYSYKVVITIILLMIIIIIFPSQVVGVTTSFIHKGITDRSLSESFENSRGFLVEESIENFSNNPLTGIGFGVSRSKRFDFIPVIEPVTGIPIGASTEKANIVVAVLEEVGIIGTGFFILFIFSVIYKVIKNSPIEYAWMCMSALAVNVGEMIFFSMNGFGLYMLILISMAIFYNLDNHTKTRHK